LVSAVREVSRRKTRLNVGGIGALDALPKKANLIGTDPVLRNSHKLMRFASLNEVLPKVSTTALDATEMRYKLNLTVKSASLAKRI
jgi:hypothetical protein